MSTFYTGVDKERYDAGEKFLPQNRFLLNYTPPTTNVEEEVIPYGIPYTEAFTNSGGGGGALQAGNINFDDFNRITTENYMRKQDTPLVDATYNQRIQDTFFGLPTYQQGVTGADAGEYLAAGQDIPLDLTGAGKMKQGLQNTKKGVAAMMGKIPSISGFLTKMGVQNFESLPPLDQAFIKQSSGYTGPTVFGNQGNMGHSVDPFGKNIESLFGNYAEGVRDDFSNLSEALSPTGKIGSKEAYQGATFNEATGMFKADDEDDPSSVAAAKKANQMNKMNLSRYNFRAQQIKKQKQNEIIQQKNDAIEKATNAKIAADMKYHNEHTPTATGGMTYNEIVDSMVQDRSPEMKGRPGGIGGKELMATGGRVGLRYGGLLSIL